MDFDLTDEQLMLRDGVERYVREEYDFAVRRKLARGDEGYSRAHWQKYAELGWLGLSLPEDVGGLACSFVETAIVLEAFGRGMVLEPFLATAVLCSRIVDCADADETRKRLLPALIEGRLILALADSENGSRDRVGCVELTSAHKTGAGYVLRGAKTMVFGAPSADQLVVSAHIEGTKEPVLLLVDPRAAGVTTRAYRLVDGSRASDIEFAGVELPAAALLIGPDRARAVLEEAADRAALGVVAQMLGVMEAVMEITAEYVKTRVQFGQPIGKFQALQHRMAEMFVDTQHARSIMYRGMAYLDRSAPERSNAVSAAKAAAGKAGRFVCAQGVQLHGGIGVTEEYPVGHYFCAMTLLEKQFGDIDFHLRRFAATRGSASQ